MEKNDRSLTKKLKITFNVNININYIPSFILYIPRLNKS